MPALMCCGSEGQRAQRAIARVMRSPRLLPGKLPGGLTLLPAKALSRRHASASQAW